MRHPLVELAAATVLVLATAATWAGGSHYGPAAGRPGAFKGEVREWAVPEAAFPRDPTTAPDGRIYFVHMLGDRLGRFDPQGERFESFALPAGTRPHNVVVDAEGMAWITGQSAHAMLRFDPRTREITSVKTSGDPHTAVIDAQGTLWFTMAGKGWLGRIDRRSLALKEYKVAGNPYGLTIDPQGRVWAALIGQDKLVVLDPESDTLRELPMPKGSMPMRMAAAPDGRLWVTFHGLNRLVAIDPQREQIIEDLALPAGPDGRAYAVTVDAAGTVWANEINTDTVLRRDATTRELRVIALPTPRAAIRKMVIDGEGRLWYLGTHNNRLGVVG